MAVDDVDVGYAAYPSQGDLIGKAYEHQNRDRAAMLKVIKREHYLVPGTTLGDHGRHLAGSGMAYFGTNTGFSGGEPALRPDGTAFTAADSGRLWIDTTDPTRPMLKCYTHGGSPAWKEIARLDVYVDDAEVTSEKNLSEILDQVLKRTSNVTFANITVTGAIEIAGDVTVDGELVGKAQKIRTVDPESYAAGDIWVE